MRKKEKGEERSQTLEDNRPFRAQHLVFQTELSNTHCLGRRTCWCSFLFVQVTEILSKTQECTHPE